MVTKRLILTASIVLLFSGLIMADSGGDRNALPINPDVVWQGFEAKSAMASCVLNKSSGVITSYTDRFVTGSSIVTHYDPADCGENDTYPFQINSFSFTLYDAGWMAWPVTVEVVVYEENFQSDKCFGPHMEVCRQTVVCEEADFEYPNMGTVTFTDPCCVLRPFYIGIEYVDEGEGPFPSMIFDDNEQVDTCDGWLYFPSDWADEWDEWYEYWEGIVPGYPICQVNGETVSEVCGCLADGDVNNDGMTLSVADYVYLVWYLEGTELPPPVPYKADINGDCAIDHLDAERYAEFFSIGLPALAPTNGLPVLTCCDPDTVTGACCREHDCLQLTEEHCQDAGGEYRGDGTYCDQRPGDVNDDMAVNIGDGVYLISYMFKGGPAPPIMANADVNGDCCVDIVDIAFFPCWMEPESTLDPAGCTCEDTDICEERIREPGDANGDNNINVADAVYVISYVFKGGPEPKPFALFSGDANNDAMVNVGDAVFLISFVFTGGAAPVTTMEWINAHTCLHPDGYMME